jgi:hypothetical protein
MRFKQAFFLVTTHTLVFVTGWFIAEHNFKATPGAAASPATTGKQSGNRPPVLPASASTVPTGSTAVSYDFRSLKRIFSGSQIRLLDASGALSEAACFMLELTKDETEAVNGAFGSLRLELDALQKAATSTVANDELRQIYRIGDFSLAAQRPVTTARQTLEGLLGSERGRELWQGVEQNHANSFCGYGKGDWRLTFEGKPESLSVHEERLATDGTVYGSSKYEASGLPERFQRLFKMESTTGN